MGRQMGFFGHARAWRALALACGIAWFGPVSGLKADTVAAGAAGIAARPAEPFGLPAVPLAAGVLHDKWSGLARRVDDDMVQLALCDGDRERCVAAGNLLANPRVPAAMVRGFEADPSQVDPDQKELQAEIGPARIDLPPVRHLALRLRRPLACRSHPRYESR